jgi:hypothetical protein
MSSRKPLRPFSALALAGAIVVLLSGPPAAAVGEPIAIWHMESLGPDHHTMVDSSSSDPPNDGKTTDVRVVNGWNRNGYKFNGSTSRVVVPDDASLDPGRQSIRITTYAKFRFLPASTTYVLLAKGGVSDRHYKVLIKSEGQAVCAFEGGIGGASVHSQRLAKRKRHQIVCGKVDRRIWIRVDGLKTIEKVRVGPIFNARRLLLGAGYNGGSQFRGGLDETTIQIG